MSNAMDANDAAAVAYPSFECNFLRFVEEDSGIVVENDDIHTSQPIICKELAVAGLREVPTLGFSQFRENDASFGSSFRMVKSRRCG